MDYVFRVQDELGRGPFKPGFSHNWVIERDDHENLRPWFEEFGRVDQEVLAGCTSGSACRTVEQLRRWFTKPEYKKLKKLGYKAYKVKVSRVIAESDIQCFVSKPTPFSEGAKAIALY